MGGTPEKASEKKIRGRLGGVGGGLFAFFFCSGLGAALVDECTALGAGCRPLWQSSSAAGTAGVEGVCWG